MNMNVREGRKRNRWNNVPPEGEAVSCLDGCVLAGGIVEKSRQRDGDRERGCRGARRRVDEKGREIYR